jgi:hypothetical protein
VGGLSTMPSLLGSWATCYFPSMLDEILLQSQSQA